MAELFSEYDLAEPFVPESFQVVPGVLIAGVDEVGRGPLVGAVVTAAVILDPQYPIAELADSKKLTEKKRERLDLIIREKALAWSLGRAEVDEVDSLNIYHATMLAMQRAVAGLSIAPDVALIDGNKCPELKCHAEAVVKGDARVPAISAASIIAKVARDREMAVLHEQYPEYGFAQHKGYGTKAHMAAIEEYGVIDQHRRSFAPVRARLEKA